MSAEQQNITKCHYRYSQINNFVSVKDFMFVKENGINHLLIRFCNFSDFQVDSITFTIIQLDASGKTLDKLKFSLACEDLFPGNIFTPSAGFKVHKDCCDCKVVFNKVISGNYVYRIKGGKIIADYCKPESDTVENSSNEKSKIDFHVKSNRIKKPIASLSLAIVSLLLIITINTSYIFAIIFENNIKQFIKEYAEAIWAEETTSADTDGSSK